MKHFRWWIIFDDMCRMGRWSFWSCKTIHFWWRYDRAENDFHVFLFQV